MLNSKRRARVLRLIRSGIADCTREISRAEKGMADGGPPVDVEHFRIALAEYRWMERIALAAELDPISGRYCIVDTADATWVRRRLAELED